MVIDAKVMDSVPLLSGPSNYIEWETAITSVFRELDLWDKVGGIEVLNSEIEAMELISGEALTPKTEKNFIKQVELISILDVDDDIKTEQKQDAICNGDHGVDDVKDESKEQMHEETDEETKENAKLRKEFRRRIDQLGRQKLQQKEEIQAHRDAEASWIILRNVEPSIVAQIRTLSSAREMWKKLQLLYIGPESIRRGHVYERLARLSYENCRNMLEYVHSFQELVAQMTQLSRPLSNFHTVHQLIAGLGMHYQAFQDRKRSLGDKLEEQLLARLCAELIDEESKASLDIRKSSFPFIIPTQEQQQPEHITDDAVREEKWTFKGTERSELPSTVHAPSRQPVNDAITDVIEEENDANEEIEESEESEAPMISFAVPAQDQQSNDKVKFNLVSPAEKEENDTENERQPFSFNIPAQKKDQRQQQKYFQAMKENVLEKQVHPVARTGSRRRKKSEYCKHCQKYGHNEEGCRNVQRNLRSRSKNSSGSSKFMGTSASSSEVNFTYTAPKNPNRNWW